MTALLSPAEVQAALLRCGVPIDKARQTLARNDVRRARSTAIPKNLHAGELAVFWVILDRQAIPRPDTEHRFAIESDGRRWAFDFAWPDRMLALEVEGGVWTRGRHTRGKGYIEDMAKYSVAAVNGWAVIRCTWQNLTDEFTTELIRRGLSRPLPMVIL